MSDYISREKYLQDVEHYNNQICYVSNVSMDDCIRICNKQPSADVIPLSVLQEIKNKIEDCSFNHYFEYGEYIGENPIQHRICMTDKVLEILSEYMKGSE